MRTSRGRLKCSLAEFDDVECAAQLPEAKGNFKIKFFLVRGTVRPALAEGLVNGHSSRSKCRDSFSHQREDYRKTPSGEDKAEKRVFYCAQSGIKVGPAALAKLPRLSFMR
mmetsp:Transcript_18430/g.26783  ORF Transcript_18430/g.26783 Transcript_18430/m.26783 type:complete len:111 (-) Transcript_18430:218-550(-)